MAPRRADHRSRAAVLVVLGSLGACNGGAQQGGGHARDAHGTSSVGGQVVSTVNGAPITLGEVRDLVEHGGLDARTALRRLQDERLLAAEARRRGLEQAWSVFDVGRKASAQALLTRTADEVVVSDVELEAAYAAQRLRFEKPERRVCVHMLAELSPKATPAQDAAARAAVERLEPMLASATDVDGFVRAYHKVGVDGVTIVTQKLPAFPRQGALVEPFAEALFSTPGPGMVSGPVKTKFGWHLIRVLEIVPPETTPREEANATLREELLLADRKKAVDALLAQLGKGYPVQLSDDAAKALNELSF